MPGRDHVESMYIVRVRKHTQIHIHDVYFLASFIIKALKCKPSAEFGGWYIRLFGLKTPCMHIYVLNEHTSMKNEL